MVCGGDGGCWYVEEWYEYVVFIVYVLVGCVLECVVIV